MRAVVQTSLFLLLPVCIASVEAQQVDADKILERADALFEEAKATYENARQNSQVSGFVDAGFKLEEVRIKYLVLQEIGSPEKQKLATDRLRSVNQLTKLVHDGKVAISSGSGVVDSPKPAEPAVKPASPDVPPAPSPAAPDVGKRERVPDPDKQKVAEKQLRELFKEDYARQSPADRKLLAQSLLSQAAKTSNDAPALWVLYREAQDISAQTGDTITAIAAAEAVERLFDIDGLSLKSTLFIPLAKAVKSPEECSQLAEAQLRLVDDLVMVDQFDTADRNTTAAIVAAKRSGDALLVTRATVRSKEVAEAKVLYQAQKRVLETLARTPDDPGANLEMGKFLCFVKGSWDLGIRFLRKGSDPALKALAEKEIALPTASADRIAIADGWFDLYEKEKSPLRKSQLLAHAKAIYESSLADAPSLVKARVEKRLDSLRQAAPAVGPVDLLVLLDPKRDVVAGEWSMTGKVLSCDQPSRCARIQPPYQLPDEYDINLVVERKSGVDAFYIGLVRNQTPFYAAVDDWTGTVTGIAVIDGRTTKDNETAAGGKFLSPNRPSTILVSVRKDAITVTVDGKKLSTYKGESSHLTSIPELAVPNRKGPWIGTNESRFAVSRYVIVPVPGPGKPGR